ncbi:MAG TPA: YicC family protein [Candidatus Saccharicenans sp.]|nr:YicC family protein [Candidatus Saccharicenans sp.]HQM74798.1 YicC family protein [Candidatus Saccharicenans sp.]
MIHSMTGFAEKSFNSSNLRVKIFIKTLNHRFFDWVFKGPGLGELENELRTACQKKISRGRVEILVEIDFLSPDSWQFTINRPLLKKMISELKTLADETGLQFNLTLGELLRLPPVITINQRELTRSDKNFILAAFDETLEEILKQRKKEGREINRQLHRHLNRIKKSLTVIENLFKQQPGELREKLVKKLKDLNHNALSEDRLSEEVAYLMQKFDVVEEINRLKSHLKAVAELLAPGADEPVGKKLDFLAQELSREANTLNAKAQDPGIIKHCLLIKNEIESMRQQVQNLE